MEALGGDPWSHVMSTLPASPAWLAHLQMSRSVCKYWKREMDIGFHSPTFLRTMAARAADFRGDVPLHGPVCPPSSHNRGIERMLHEDDWIELVTCMQECVGDLGTQAYIMTQLRTHLFYPQFWDPQVVDHQIFHSAMLARKKARDIALAPVVAWVLRMHPQCLSLQLECCHVLCYIQHTLVQLCPHTAYIIGSLADVMQEYPVHVEVQRVCLRALECLVDDFHSEICGLCDNSEEDSFRQCIEVSAVIETGKHNVPMLIVRVLHLHPTDYDLNLLAVKVLKGFMNMLVHTDRTIQMHTYVTREVESAILDCMSRHARSLDDIVAPPDHYWPIGLAEVGVSVLHRLVQVDIGGLRRCMDIMQAATNTAVKHGSRFVGAAVELVSDILSLPPTSQVQCRDMQNCAADVGIVSVVMTHIMQLRKDPRYAKFAYSVPSLVEGLFHLLTVMCQDNAQVTTRMRRANVLDILQNPSVMGPETHSFHESRDTLLEAMRSACDEGAWDAETTAIAEANAMAGHPV